jgi:hypothetical protein
MPHREDLGFQSLPENGLKIVRSRTLLGNMRLWEIPRSEQALETVVEEIGRSPIPGLYVLLDERAEKRAYIGQTEKRSTSCCSIEAELPASCGAGWMMRFSWMTRGKS